MNTDQRQSASTETGIEVNDIHKTFFPNSVQEKKALRGVEFSLEQGDFAVVIGSNGAGKSTMLNAIAGEISIDRGTLRVGPRDITSEPTHKRARLISRVFQDPMTGTAASLSIEENLAIARRRGRSRTLRSGIGKSERDQFREKLAPLGLGLENRMKDRVSLLSGGQRQSLTLIMATLTTPQLLLLDEHCAALDPRAAELVMNATRSAVETSNVTTIMITHNMEHAISMGNRLLMMHEGKVILDLNQKEKSNLKTADLVERFHDVVSDRMLLN